MASEYQIGVRIPPNLKDDIDREMKLSNRDNVSEFVKDAIKFYIWDLENRRKDRNKGYEVVRTIEDD